MEILFSLWFSAEYTPLIWEKHTVSTKGINNPFHTNIFHPELNDNKRYLGTLPVEGSKDCWEIHGFNKRAELEAICDYLHTELLIKALNRKYNYLIPNWVQVLIYDFTFVQCLPIQLKFHIGITCAFKRKKRARKVLKIYGKAQDLH